MSDAAELTYELLKRFHAEFTDFRREQLSMSLGLSAMEQHLAANQIEFARLRVDMAQVKNDIASIKCRLDLVDA